MQTRDERTTGSKTMNATEPSFRTPDYYEYECGCKSCQGGRGTGAVEKISGLCLGCRTERIGQRIDFLRFGSVPSAGHSTNHRDRTTESGVSVYEVVAGKAVLVGWSFGFTDRPAWVGTGTITGWGSDGEPLVKVETVRKAKKSEVNTMI